MTIVPPPTALAASPRIAVIGAGITGVTTAYKLNRRGFDVTVFDRLPLAGMETSFANGGQLSACNTEVWNNWPTIRLGLKWMFRRDAPLLVHPAPGWRKLSWFAGFLAATRNYRESTITLTRMAIAARAHLLDMAADEGVAFDRADHGILHLYDTAEDFAAAARLSALLREGGLAQQPVTAEEIRALEPALHGNYYGGFHTPSDFTGDAHKYTVGLAEACRRRGVAFHHDATVNGLRHLPDGVEIRWQGPGAATATERFDALVIAAGTGSRALAAMIGERVNIYPVKGYSITVNMADEASRAAAPWVSVADEHARVVTARLGADRLRIAGTAEFCGENRDIRMERINPLIAWCRHRFPAISVEHVVPWAGLRPMLPGLLPRVGWARRGQVFLNTGHGHLGWTLAAITAETTAAAMEERFLNRLVTVSGTSQAA